MRTLRLLIPAILAIATFARADAITDRLSALEGRVGAIEIKTGIAVAPEPAPATAPATQPIVTTLAQLKAAIDAGATTVATPGLVIANDALDLRGTTLKQSGAVGGQNLLLCVGKASVINGTLVSDPNAGSAIAVMAARDAAKTSDVTLTDLTLAPGGNGFLGSSGNVTATRCHATTFVRYWYFGGEGSYLHAVDCMSLGGSSKETTFRVGGGRYWLERCTLDQSAPGNLKTAVVRGNAPPYPDGRPGGVIVGSTLTGNVTPEPLGGDDGGQNLGIDRFCDANGADTRDAYAPNDPLAGVKHAAFTLAVFKQTPLLVAAGKTREQIVAANAALLPQRPAIDIAKTLAARDAALAERSKVQIVDTTINGDVRYQARGDTTFTRCTLKATATGIVLAGEATYPQPLERRLSLAEVVTSGSMLFDHCTVSGQQLVAGLPITYASSVVNGVAVTTAATQPTTKPVSLLDQLKSGTAVVDARNRAVTPLHAGATAAYCDDGGWQNTTPADYATWPARIDAPVWITDDEPTLDAAGVAGLNARVPARVALIHAASPGRIVGCYGPVGGDYWPYVNASDPNWQPARDAIDARDLSLLPAMRACDLLVGGIYPYYPESGPQADATTELKIVRDRAYVAATRARLERLSALAGGKPIALMTWSVDHETTQPLSTARADALVDDCAGCNLILWGDWHPDGGIGDRMIARRLAAMTR